MYIVQLCTIIAEALLKCHNLEEKPGQIFNIDESGVSGKSVRCGRAYGLKGDVLYQKKVKFSHNSSF